MTNVGATHGAVFYRFMSDYLLTLLQPGDIVLLDRAGAHFRKEVIALIEQHGGCVRYLPPYSPDFNPIEVAEAMLRISTPDAANWFKACGFQVQATCSPL